MRDAFESLGFTLAAGVRPALGRRHLEKYQLRKFRGLLGHAMATVPYYHDLYLRHGIKPEDIHSREDLHRIPLTGKDHQKEFLQPGADTAQLVEHKTSGSTGKPVHFYRTPGEERRLNMLRWRMYLMMGLRPGDRMAKLKTTWESLPSRFERLKKAARKVGLVDRRVFDCLQPPADTLEELENYQPDILTGYPGALVKVAQIHSADSGRLPGLRRIFCGGEHLSTHQRQLLEQRFGVPLIDTYGATECNLAAWQCPHADGYHVCDDGVLLEICRDGVPVAPGEEGDVVITALHSRMMPIIRYSIGDRAVAGSGSCSCGSPFSSLKALQGRIIDFITLPDGRQFHPFRVLNEIVIAGSDWIAEYQLIQEELDRFRLMVVPARTVKDEEEILLRQAMAQELGAAAQLMIEWVDAIPVSGSGKFHFCRSLVTAAQGGEP